MARIRARQTGDRLKVIISGALTAEDIGRLEHACSPALTSQVPKLDILLQHDTPVDAAAAVFLQRLALRGACIISSLSIVDTG